ncbi:hypothetical protein DFJ58DRAFT_717670 [Suillus subalutaceus]|uniref:uncharacterized protein n=1 Tax=Suillus subalutaceus TaxID=48586 RepID=UPI001B87E420|nr:uncharacterized protein DFJ58DRAFT_717670 [Suillus subalutaceus]KAG1844036.1 hypothetical protein DFJ58DRAFT_717670 [Suillus subalutaceus]
MHRREPGQPSHHIKQWSIVISYFHTYEPELVRQWKANRLRRKRFWAAGVNDLFAVDQHDKWLRYGLGLHTGIEPFSGRIMWMRVWHSNRNPQLILSYYLDTLGTLGHMPMVTQSDPGSENYGIANAHTMLRQWHDPALQGSLQHRWMRTKKNVMPEITWSQMWCRFTPGFETLLDHGVTSGWYDTNNTLQLSILPHGAPDIIYQSPKNFGVLDFKIQVEREALDHVHDLYIDPSHIVFDLVPKPFSEFMEHCYTELGHPLVTRQTTWDVYLRLLAIVEANDEMIPRHIELELISIVVDQHLHELESLARDDEPDITLGIDESVVGLDHAGLVVWDFSDDDNSDVPDEW